MLYQKNAPGDWGQMRDTDTARTATEMLALADGCKLFLRSWKTGSPDVLLILHGLGAHSGWFIDMGNQLASRGLTVYAGDHRGFGRSEGLPGHIDDYHTYVKDIHAIVTEIRKRHPGGRIYLLGHSMGGIFAAHFAAQYGSMLAGVIFLNPWVQDRIPVPLGTMLAILVTGIFKSKRAWHGAAGVEAMTANPEAIQILEADSYWRRAETASFLVQILWMRLATLRKAAHITLPALVLQAEADKTLVLAASHKLYEALASTDKTWKTYPGYAHDSEFEADRLQMDNDIAAWIREHGHSV